jgi:hypothetical protein
LINNRRVGEAKCNPPFGNCIGGFRTGFIVTAPPYNGDAFIK